MHNIPKIPYKQRLSFKALISTLEQFYGIPSGTILSNIRTLNIANVRAIAMHMCRHLGKMSYQEVGMAFNRHHATVMHACKLVDGWAKKDKRFAAEYNRNARRVISESRID